MNADLSAAPEIARLAAPPSRSPRPRAATPPPTAGRVAAGLARIAAAPRRWWDLVRFDPDGPVRIPLPDAPGTWLLVLPPGATADCDCTCATLLAGEAAESAASPGASPRPLRPGRVLVNGRRAPHRARGAGHGYAVSLHWAATPARSERD